MIIRAATTDLANTPMANAFHRAGYRNTETRLVLEPRPTRGSGLTPNR